MHYMFTSIIQLVHKLCVQKKLGITIHMVITDVSYDVDSTHKLVGWAAERNGTENIADKNYSSRRKYFC